MGLMVNGCCCCNLRTAGLIHGWVGIVLLTFGIIITINRIINYDPNDRPIDSLSQKPRTLSQEVTTLVTYIIDVFCSGLLLTGIEKNKHCMLIPWLVLRGIGLLLGIPVGVFILFSSTLLAAPAMIIVTLIYAGIIGLFVWSWIVICSLYEQIRYSNKPLPMTVPVYESHSGPVILAPPYQEFENKVQIQK